MGAASNTTRILWAGTYLSSTRYNYIDVLDATTTGNCSDFGDLTVARFANSAFSSATRGVFLGGDQA